MKQKKNIYPVFDRIIQQADKEKLLKQHSLTIWFTGLSGSGKTTIAVKLEKQLHQQGYITQVLDGDNVRLGINNNLGFSEKDRQENIRRVAEISKLFNDCGIITINCFVSPTRAIRALAKKIIGKERFLEIFLDTPLEVCEKRDVKGLYKKARKGEVKNFTGISAPFEKPKNSDLRIDTSKGAVDTYVSIILDVILPRIKY